MDFIKAHSFTIFCILGIVWLGVVVYNQFKFKNKGVLLKATVVENKQQSGNYFPVYRFEYEGQTLTVDGHMGNNQPTAPGTETDIYYLPGNTKGVMTTEDVKIKGWQVGLLVGCLVYVVLDLLRN